MRTCILIVLGALALAACDKPEPVDIAPQRQALEKAKGVEDTLQRTDDERRKQLEEAEKN
jgi:hypothetical protein